MAADNEKSAIAREENIGTGNADFMFPNKLMKLSLVKLAPAASRSMNAT
jgi:hypothetical protein